MSCRCFVERKRELPREAGAKSALPRMTTVPVCVLGRPWAKIRCKETPKDGPCWWWIEQRGETRDQEFEECREHV